MMGFHVQCGGERRVHVRSCDVSLRVKHRFRSAGENTKQPARPVPGMSLLIGAPAVYGNRQAAVHLLKAPE